MSLSLIIPVYNEESQIETTIRKLILFQKKFQQLEIIFINDFSTDETKNKINKLIRRKKFIKFYDNKKKGLGSAIQVGILKSKKNYICIFMADLSDDFKDLKKYYLLMKTNKYDAILGSRFLKGSKISNYPITKLILNRIFNNFVRIIFFSRYNDFTNAFKIYKRKSLLELLPMISENFNVFLEIPLKIISRNYSYLIIPINWNNRKHGKSKFKIKELGSMYIFTLLYCFIEKILLKKSLKKVI